MQKAKRMPKGEEFIAFQRHVQHICQRNSIISSQLSSLLAPLKQFLFLCTFFFLFFSDFSSFIASTITKLPGILSQSSQGCKQKGSLTLNHKGNTLEKTPTKYPYDRLRKEPLKNRTIKNSKLKLQEQNEFIQHS